MATELASAYVTIIPSLKGASRTIETAMGGASVAAGRTLSQGLSAGFKDFVKGNLVMKAVDAVGGAVSSHLSGAVARVDTLNQFPKVMTSLGYGADEAQASIDAIADRLSGLPSTTSGVATNVQMLTATLGDLDRATDVGLALNDMFLAGGQGAEAADRALVQFNQMLATGKVDMQSWGSVVQTAPGQLDQLAKSLVGAEADQRDLYAALQSGTISMDDFVDAIVKLDTEGGEGFESFESQARAATGGISTALSNWGNRINNAIAKVIDAIGGDRIGDAIDAVSSHFGDLGKAAAAVVTGLAPTIDKLFGAWDGIFSRDTSGLADKVTETFGTAFEAINRLFTAGESGPMRVFDGFASALDAIGGERLARFGWAVRGAFEHVPEILGDLSIKARLFGKIWSEMVPGLKLPDILGDDAYERFHAKMRGMKDSLLNLRVWLRDNLTAETMRAGIQSLLDATEKFRNGLDRATAPLRRAGSVALKQFKAVREAGGTAGEALKSSFGEAMSALVGDENLSAVGRFLEGLRGSFEGVVERLRGPLDHVRGIVTDAFGRIAGRAGETFGRMWDQLSGGTAGDLAISAITGKFETFAPLVEGVANVLLTLAENALPLVTSALQTFDAVFSPIQSALTDLGTSALSTIEDFIVDVTPKLTEFVEGLAESDGVSTIAETAQGLISSVADSLPDISSALSSIAGPALDGVSGFIETIAPHVKTIGDAMGEAWVKGWDTISTVAEKLEPLGGPLGELFGAIGGAFADIGAALVGNAGKGIEAIGGLFEGLSGDDVSSLGDTISGIATSISELGSAIANLISGDGSDLNTWIDNNILGPLLYGDDLAEGETYSSKIEENFTKPLEDFLTGFPGSLADAAATFADSASTWFSDTVVKPLFGDGADDDSQGLVQQKFDELVVQPVSDFVDGFPGNLAEAVAGFADSAGTWLADNIVKPLFGDGDGVAEEGETDAAKWFETHVTGPISAVLADPWGAVSEAASSFAESAGTWLHDTFVAPLFGGGETEGGEGGGDEFSTWFDDHVTAPISAFLADPWGSVQEAVDSFGSSASSWLHDTFVAPLLGTPGEGGDTELATWFADHVTGPVSDFLADPWGTVQEAVDGFAASAGTWLHDNVLGPLLGTSDESENTTLVADWFDENVVTPINDFLADPWGGITAATETLASKVLEWLGFDDVDLTGLTTMMNNIGKVISDPIGAAKTFLFGSGDSGGEMGDVASGFESFSVDTTALSEAFATVQSVMEDPIGAAKTALLGGGDSGGLVGDIVSGLEGIGIDTNSIWSAFQSAADAMKGPIEAVASTIGGLVSGIIQSLNNVTIAANSTKASVEGATGGFGGGGWGGGFDGATGGGGGGAAHAKGAILTGPQVSLAGESGHEAIVPLYGREMMPYARAVAEDLALIEAGNQTKGGTVVNVYVDGETIAINSRLEGRLLDFVDELIPMGAM